MQALPRDPVPPKRLGALQFALWSSVVSAAQAFDESRETLDPRQASATLSGFMRANPGHDERQVRASAALLVSRDILRVSQVGWSLSQREYDRLLNQRVRELTA